MKITRAAILSKTSYGINVYAHILCTYYPEETVLSLSGRDCKPARNPFNNHKFTLIIKIVDNCAQHTDSENAIESGDVFSFAQMHFKQSGQELLKTINDELFLRIGESSTWYNQSSEKEHEIDIPEFSFFEKPITNKFPYQTVSLADIYKLIKSAKIKPVTDQLRAISDHKAARSFKASNFNYVTFSGVFKQRENKELIKHSGLLTIDFDHIDNIDNLKKILLNDESLETELLFISPSGDGLKWIIPIDLQKADHLKYFTAVQNYLKYTYEIEIDNSGKDLARACFIPHDPEVFIHPKYESHVK